MKRPNLKSFVLILLCIPGIIIILHQSKLADQLKVLVYASDATSNFCAMAQSVLYHDALLTVDGMNSRESDPKSRKTQAFYEMSKFEAARDPNQILAFLDSYDIFMLRPVKEVIDRFVKSGATILYNAEKNCWPYGNDETAKQRYCSVFIKSTPDKLWSLYKADLSPRYLNSGGLLCRAKDCLEWFEESMSTKPEHYWNDDQAIAFALCEEWGSRCTLDYFSTIFQSMLSWDVLESVVSGLPLAYPDYSTNGSFFESDDLMVGTILHFTSEDSQIYLHHLGIQKAYDVNWNVESTHVTDACRQVLLLRNID